MTQVELSDNAKARVTGMVELRQIVNQLIQEQLDDYPDEDIKTTQAKLNTAYDAFTAKYGLLNDRKNGRLFEDDSSYYLLCSLENLDENKQLKSKADMFTKRTIRPEHTVTSVDTPSEALTRKPAGNLRTSIFPAMCGINCAWLSLPLKATRSSRSMWRL